MKFTNFVLFMLLTNFFAAFAHASPLIDWQIGQSQDYRVTTNQGTEGTLHKEVMREEGDAIWIRQEMRLETTEVTEILLDRTAGKVLKYIHTGKEEAIPLGALEITSSETDFIEVEAGKFQVTHITGKTTDAKRIEIWLNPKKIPMDGAAKIVLDQGTSKLNIELIRFHR